MERALEQNLENHAKDAADFPEIRTRIEQHIQETQRHAELIRGCLAQLNESPSTVKAWWGSMMGKAQGVSTGMYADEPVKNILADYAAEHFEIACYTSLIAAAEELRLEGIAETCREILREEEEMADWLCANIPAITQLHLQQVAERQTE
jgi:ferritin-like metal-binding protein YciE